MDRGYLWLLPWQQEEILGGSLQETAEVLTALKIFFQFISYHFRISLFLF
jgi:hypothetical protein